MESDPGGLSGDAGPDLPSGDDVLYRGRLHPLTLVVSLWTVLKGFLVPFLVLMVLNKGSYWGGFIVVFVALPLLLGLVRYFTFSYRVEGPDLITRQGLFKRTERHIPLARVQDLRVEQGLLHRALKIADVHVETAGGRGVEAVLSVLSLREADRLRRAIMTRKSDDTTMTFKKAEQWALPEQVPLRQVRLRELVVAGLTSNHLASALAIFAVVFGLLDDVVPEEKLQRWLVEGVEKASQWMGNDEVHRWQWMLAGGLLMLGIGLAVSVAGSVILFHRFSLSRVGEDVHRSYGLLTRRSSSLARKRIQVLKIEEKLTRRPFRLATLRADTAGGFGREKADANAGRDVLLPIVPRSEVAALLPELFPGLRPDRQEWRAVSRRAIRRGTTKGGAACVILSGVTLLAEWHWSSLWPLALIPLIYILNRVSYRHLGFCLDDRFFQTRHGWLSRSQFVVPVRNIQSVTLRRTALDRHHGVSTVRVDTAGQAYTGGGPMLDNVPEKEAETLAWTLAKQAAKLRYGK